MNWVLDNIPLLVFAFVLFSVIRAIFRAAQLSAKKQTEDETAEQRRVREIQERIRKKIAERRGAAAPPETAQEGPAVPMLRPSRVPPLEPFGGPSRRLVIETMRRVMAPMEPAPEEAEMLARQQKLAEQVRALDEARAVAGRRAAQMLAQRENTTASSSAASHAGRLGDLRDPQALRRAFVLREVLGAPVGLR